ncbi:lactose-binding lectin l-2-like [Astyanax mexicanus]|uniref:lactose-binding lectin l-2-like n=1 Tax=Astyanax mexicanus TaxID=7994 RepID=UPI0020CB090B|nr:lactose-binding lectin l-2-like [Astyanax mexicanus]
MVRVAELSLLFACFGALASSDTDLDTLVQEQIKGQPKKDGSCTAACPYGWVKFDNRCFTYFASPLDWYSAEIYCVNLGANLASMHNENEYQMVKSLIRAHDPDENPAWIGLSACQKKFGWVWSDGTRFDFTRWNSNEPNYSHNGECCVNINWAYSVPEKRWNDNPCEETFPFVCVKRLN